MEIKSRHPVNQCQITRRLLVDLQVELNLQIDLRDHAASRVQDLTNRYFAAAEEEVRRRIALEQGEFEQQFQRAKRKIVQLEVRIRDVENDYYISGCHEITGEL